MSIESEASFQLCSLGWRAMEEENEGERYESTGNGGIGNHLGVFLEYFKNFEVFFLKNTCQVIL